MPGRAVYTVRGRPGPPDASLLTDRTGRVRAAGDASAPPPGGASPGHARYRRPSGNLWTVGAPCGSGAAH
ncbi:hypothetical protein GCM10010260_70920 [Streptomyces filipinensis]|uniref:Uncharacterized protein n=1 Tax=Streptomyces filipinensis TaxID=66887 RepID=A0A918III0_9ACTN|nr:hypothetical protein GCM10010260_70920 [Streptomyces filipinensis]